MKGPVQAEKERQCSNNAPQDRSKAQVQMICHAYVEPAAEAPAQQQQAPFPRNGDSEEAVCFPAFLIFAGSYYFARSR